jgi:hypothetical protein
MPEPHDALSWVLRHAMYDRAVNAVGAPSPSLRGRIHHLASFGGSEQEMITFMSELGYSVRTLQGEFSRDLLFWPSTPEHWAAARTSGLTES